MIKRFVQTVLVMAIVSLGACASGARPQQIVASVAPGESFETGHPLRNTLNVERVQGGSETNPMWMSNISSEEFSSGLEQSLRNAGLLAESPALAQYRVIANIQDLQRPMIGLDMTVRISVRYTISPTTGGPPIFDEVVFAAGVGRMGDALIGVERLRIANEAAVRENITEFLRRLHQRVPSASISPVS